MLFRDVVKLISITVTENDMGDIIETPVEREVFADKQSIRQSEFYQAAATGLRPELMFVMRTIDYNQETKLRWPAIPEGKVYNIIRTYDKDGELIELICQGWSTVPMPKSVTKIKNDGIEFISNVDRARYTIQELSRAALRDVAKLIRKRMVQKLKKLPGMKRSKRIYNSTQYWVRKRETDLQIGFKHDTWYGVHQELGDRNQPARHILRGTVMENIDEIRKIEGQYLSAIEDENKALALIDEKEYVPEGDEE